LSLSEDDMHGFYRVAAAVPRVRVGNVDANLAETLTLWRQAAEAGADVIVFPELGLTGYTCADLFHQQTLIDAAATALGELADASATIPGIAVVGLPVLMADRLYNCAAVVQGGTVAGVVPKSHLPTYKEFYEKRWFTSGMQAVDENAVTIAGRSCPFGTDLLFAAGDDLVIGIEICEDLWSVIPPSCHQALAGANLLINLSASNELVAKADYRRDLVVGQSARCVAAYVYASCGVTESTTDLVFSGHSVIAENGVVLAETARFERQNSLVTADIDCQRLRLTRLRETSMNDLPRPQRRTIEVASAAGVTTLSRHVDPHPFVPGDPDARDLRCHEIFSIQIAGLAKRLEHIGAQRAVVGISGGLDSTLALLVTVEAVKLLALPPSSVIAVTMPGFGTTDRTHTNAVSLCRELAVDLRDIDITAACTRHFADIGHDPAVHDITYQNVQARERTQVLMDIANREGGIVVGTGDLSEVALGWSTYNGDQMSMYGVNSSVPKTLVRYVIGWAAERSDATVRATLMDVLDTPISPELLPQAEDGSIAQRTEDEIGPYELHDFFLYHSQKYGAPPEKIEMLAQQAFVDYDAATIRRWLVVFFRRFFAQQFKRSCFPDGPKVGTISLSPRGDWRMPSDAEAAAWLARISESSGGR
jgi:NAD+ synthase (glutamine-hydrolysing)